MRKSIYLLAIFAAVAFVFAGCGKKTVENGQTVDTGKDTSIEEFQSTIEEVAKSGKPYQCTYTTDAEGVAQEGTIYFAGVDKMRGDITVDMPETGKTVTHFIKDGETQYMWGDNQPTGMKITMTKEEEESLKDDAQANQQSVDMDMKVNLKCKKWSPDKSVLTPPSNVKFQDLSEMMKNLPALGGSTEGASAGGTGATINPDDIDMCAICDQIPAGAARDSCKQSNC